MRPHMNTERLVLVLQIRMIASAELVTTTLIIVVLCNHAQCNALDGMSETSIELAKVSESLRRSKDESITFPQVFRALGMHGTAGCQKVDGNLIPSLHFSIGYVLRGKWRQRINDGVWASHGELENSQQNLCW